MDNQCLYVLGASSLAPLKRDKTRLHPQRLHGASKCTPNRLRLNPAPFVPGSREPAAPCPPDPVRCRASVGRMAHKNAPGSAASGRGARARGPFPCQPPGPGSLRSPGPLPGPTFGIRPSPGPAAAGGGKDPGVPASRRHAPAT